MRQTFLEKVGSAAVCVDSGVDYFTGVTLESTQSSLLSLHFSPVLDHERRVGNLMKPWGMSGFVGFSCGSVQMGARGEEMIVRLSSKVAQRHWRKLYQLSDNVTRCDLQVTLLVEHDVDHVVHGVYRAASRHSSRLRKGPAVTLIRNLHGGDTCYLGKRSSDQYARAYNKAVESKQHEYAGCVRLECEFKGDRAKLVVRQIAGQRGSQNLEREEVFAFFKNRGASFGLVPTDLDNSLPAPRSDLQRKLRWLQGHVRSSVELLIEAGMSDDVFAALGLPGPATR